MSVLIRFAPASLTAAQYDESVRKLEEAGHFRLTDSTTTSASVPMATFASARSGTPRSSSTHSASD